ncbi:MAG: type I restriction endonuclease subunit R [Tannerellaceae bacterium]
MNAQPEQILENNLVGQLMQLGYEKVEIADERDLLANLRLQLEKHNERKLSEQEFAQVLNGINKGSIFERAKVLRDRVAYTRDNGERTTLELLNTTHWCKNEFQVTQQVTMEGRFKNRYDVTVLINGLPLVQIELKRRGLELKEAFNQTNRYERHSYGAGQGLFHFIQLFVISNGVNTKYYANNPVQGRSFEQTFYWSNEQNKPITGLQEFADVFLEKCHLAKMITRYTVLNETSKLLMVLRPYQYYAVEAIVERVLRTHKPGYIWHTTGSGKTLTSFKAAQILKEIPKVHKVVFVVDRKDLDYQTTKEFNSFCSGSVDGTTNTRTLVDQLAGDQKLIVTTIQKLNTAIIKEHYTKGIEHLRNERVVFIFDECHRSQFGKTHDAIKKFFEKSQLFGFTGTPIMEQNAGTNEFGKRTTKMLFGDVLHSYVITDAIRDENVLKFSVEYIRTFKRKENIVDIEVEDIDRPEVMNAPERLANIVDYIIANHDKKTHNKKYTAIFCVAGVPQLIEYYKLLRERYNAGAHDLKVATIFSYQANEEDKDAVGFIDELDDEEASSEPTYNTQHSRDALEEFIGDYNRMFGSNFTTRDTDSFYKYYNDIAKKVKNQQVDILLVVNMFLTGFDSKFLNTLYVDKNLKYHGLLQAYSRTNRILNEQKSQGNIVCFRNLKKATDEAIELFSSLTSKDEIIMQPYEVYVRLFDEAFARMQEWAPTVDSVSMLQDEEHEFAFVKAFRELLRLRNVLKTFSEFTHDDLQMSELLFDNYKSKYLDLYDKVKRGNGDDKTSILNDLNFELELIHRDEINVAYILKLLAKLHESSAADAEKQKKVILDMMAGDKELRSKRELIEKFIRENLPEIEDAEDIPEEFDRFMKKERVYTFYVMCEEEQLDDKMTEMLIKDCIYTDKEPLRDDIVKVMRYRPALKNRKSVTERIATKITDFVETFVDGV